MRLLHVRTLELVYFAGDKVPPYAILSHTWGKDEPVYEDIQRPVREWEPNWSDPEPRWAKTIYACKQAQLDRLDYLWIDTLCIDKSSSAELSEAINSMYAWYARAVVCYAYLADIHVSRSFKLDPATLRHTKFPRSRWFTRGWTLQELIAPSVVRFYSQNWQELGSKSQPALAEYLGEITGIDAEVLVGEVPIESVCVARRFSWASRRRTTRVEDMAYCLLGLFDVNLPLIYGEGKKSFLRLQDEILKSINDHSIFIWELPSEDRKHGKIIETGLLATSVEYFRSIDTRNLLVFRDWTERNSSFTITNSGLSIELSLRQLKGRYHVAILNCSYGMPYCVCILVQSLADDVPSFRRVHGATIAWPRRMSKRSGVLTKMYVPQAPSQVATIDVVSGRMLRGHLSRVSTMFEYRVNFVKYQNWSSKTPGLEQQEGVCRVEGTSQGTFNAWRSSQLKFQICGVPNTVSVAFSIQHVPSDTSFFVLVGTGPESRDLHIACCYDTADDPDMESYVRKAETWGELPEASFQPQPALARHTAVPAPVRGDPQAQKHYVSLVSRDDFELQATPDLELEILPYRPVLVPGPDNSLAMVATNSRFGFQTSRNKYAKLKLSA